MFHGEKGLISARKLPLGGQTMISESYLRNALRGMTYKSRMYQILKEELSARGNWKNRPRGAKGPAINFSRPRQAQQCTPAPDSSWSPSRRRVLEAIEQYKQSHA